MREIEFKGKRILIADDDPFNRELLQMELSDAGFEVIVAGDGEDALRKVQELPVDLLLLDVMMPKIDGVELVRKLRQQKEFENLPIILLTAKAQTKDKLLGLEAGANDYITKPFDIRELLARVKVQLRLAELERQSLEAERVKGVLEMAGAAAHELSQPISGAMGHVYLMLMEEDIGDGRKAVRVEDLKNTEDCLKRATDILHRIQGIRRYEVRDYPEGMRIVDIEKASEETPA
ncbi:MAG: response regulator [Calditrichaeota bacterium]|nr:response regulator [Calditrichota bacterium]